MNIVSLLWGGIQSALLPQNLLSAFFGGIIGLVVGALPGIGSLAGVSLLLPLTFKMNPNSAIIMLAALYYSNMYGGAFSAILINIPGDSPAVMTALDGYPMSRKGRAGQALFTANLASFIGGTLGILILTLVGPAAAHWGLAFGPPELAWLIILALTSIGWIVGDNVAKGLVATGLGIMIATIGLDKALGMPRFAFFNSVNLYSGINMIPLVIGMFGFGQVIDMILSKQEPVELAVDKLSLKDCLPERDEIKSIARVSSYSGPLGTFIGILPGAGATIAAFLSYIFQKRVGRNRENMGTGVVEGIAAAESANNGAAMGAFAPLLALGIPGGGTTAVLLGGLMMWGLQPGPLLFETNPDFVWGLIGSMYIGNIICLAIALACIPFSIRVIKVPPSIMIPIISSICVVGTFATNNSIFDVYLMIGAGFLAYLLKKADIPLAPLLLAFVLTPMFEMYLRQSFDMSAGSISIFFRSSISITLLIATVLFCTMPKMMEMFKKKMVQASNASAGKKG